MKKNEENIVVDIKDTKVLKIINNMLESNDFFPVIEDDLRDISKTQTIHFGNIQELMTYLNYAFESNSHYYDGLKYLLEVEKIPVGLAIEKMDIQKENEDFLYKELLTYLVPDVMNKNNQEVK